MIENWKEHPQDYWLIKDHPPNGIGFYVVYYLPMPVEVPFDYFEGQGYENSIQLAEDMIAHGVRVVSFDEWKQWFQNRGGSE